MSGVTMYQKEYESANEVTIDLTGRNLATGVYLLRSNIDGRVCSSQIGQEIMLLCDLIVRASA
jgi:hypothetical protein